MAQASSSFKDYPTKHKTGKRPRTHSTTGQHEGTASDASCISTGQSDSDENNDNRWGTRQFNVRRRECFICEKVEDRKEQTRHPSTSAESGHDGAKGDDDDDKSSVSPYRRMRKCGLSCTLRFHEGCFLTFNEGDFLPRFHILDKTGDPCIDLRESKKWICPQHECNFCHQELLRTRAFMGKFIRCVKCVFAWHRSCVIVGSKHINRSTDRYVLCPRHNDLQRVSKRNVPYCIKCENVFGSNDQKVACGKCIRSFCYSCSDAAQEPQLDDTPFVCEFCWCVDFPRIGDYVLASYKSSFYPAKTLHADQLPLTLYSKRNLVDKLYEPGYVLVQWVEGLEIPNYDVVTFRDVVPFPKTLKCQFWNRMKAHRNIYEAVKAVYNNPEAAVGIRRPLPPEVKAEAVPKYTRITTNINMRLAKARLNSAGPDQCNCKPIKGKRCTVAHGCLNRALMAECPEDCDAFYLENRNSELGGTKRQVMKKSAEIQKSEISDLPERMCTNNFLRYHNFDNDKLLMEEKPTELKGFGVFAKCGLPKGTDLTEYVGIVMVKDEYFRKMQFRGSFNNLENSYFGMHLKNDFYVDARNSGNIARSINHSCEPNCKVDVLTVDGIYRLKISTIKDIDKGEELAFDYDTEIPDGLVGTECFCGSANCRKVIGRKTTVGGRKSRYMKKRPVFREQADDGSASSEQRGATTSAEDAKENAERSEQLRRKRGRKRKKRRNADETKRLKKNGSRKILLPQDTNPRVTTPYILGKNRKNGKVRTRNLRKGYSRKIRQIKKSSRRKKGKRQLCQQTTEPIADDAANAPVAVLPGVNGNGQTETESHPIVLDGDSSEDSALERLEVTGIINESELLMADATQIAKEESMRRTQDNGDNHH